MTAFLKPYAFLIAVGQEILMEGKLILFAGLRLAQTEEC